MVESVIAQAMRDGAADLTAFEVMTAIERVYGVDPCTCEAAYTF